MDYTKEQEAIAMAEGPRILAHALAGTGKTETVALRIELLIARGVPAHQILCLCYTKAAVRQLTQRLEDKMIEGVTVRTIDAHAHLIVMRWADERNLTIKLTSGEYIAKHLLSRYGLKASKSEVRRFLSLSTLRWLGRPIDVTIPGIAPGDVDRVVADYDKEKRRLGLVDFTDVLVMASGIPSRKYAYVIVDEAQDSTSAHTRFIEGFTGESLMMVGDEHQSIFEFSGVDPHLFSKYCKDWRELKLTKSFRSSQGVLRVVNSILPDDFHLTSDREDEGLIQNYTTHLGTLDALLKQEGSKALLGRTRNDLFPFCAILKELGVEVGKSWEGDSHRDFQFFASTVHSAKGLEWDSVAVMNLSEVGFRGVMRGRMSDIEGERRLAYVAASRAKTNLFLHSYNGMLPYSYGGEAR